MTPSFHHSTTPPLLNRALPSDGWFHVVPKGEFPHDDSGTVQVLDDAALDAMVQNFKTPALQPSSTPAELLVDQDHFSYDPSKSSAAMGWIKDLAKRANGLWAKIDLTPPGLDAVKNGLYRFVSPVWAKADCENLGSGRLRPLRLDSVGLTNSPNLKGMVPLSNRAGQPGGSGLPPATGRDRKVAPTPTTTKGESMKDKLIPVLGLAADAADSAVVEAVTQLKNRVGSLETANTDLKKSNRELLEAQVEADLAKYADRIANKDAMKKALLANRAATIEMLDSIKPVEKPVLHNRVGLKTPDSGLGTHKSKPQQAEELVRSKMLANRCGYKAAFELAVAEKPELFIEEKETE